MHRGRKHSSVPVPFVHEIASNRLSKTKTVFIAEFLHTPDCFRTRRQAPPNRCFNSQGLQEQVLNITKIPRLQPLPNDRLKLRIPDLNGHDSRSLLLLSQLLPTKTALPAE